MSYDLVILLGLGVLAFASIATFLATFFTVEHRTNVIVQRFGKFTRAAGPGIRFKIPFIDKVVGFVNMRVRQLEVEIETRTRDDAFVRVVIAVQYYALPDKVYDAFYKLDDADRQITSFVLDVVRAHVPKIKLDDVFEKKNEIAEIVKSELVLVMEGFGYGIFKVLVPEIDPDAKVKQAMNEINAAQRMRVAATAGLRDSVEELRKSVPGTTAKDVMNLVLLTQYFEMLREIGASSRSNAILIPHSPDCLAALTEQMRSAVIETDQTTKSSESVLAPLPGLAMAVEGSAAPYGHKHQAAKRVPGNGG